MEAEHDSKSLVSFRVLYTVTQLVGIALVVLMGCWLGIYLGGFGGSSTPKLEFNWHPLLMTIGMIFLYGNSILIYRGLQQAGKETLKYTHASIHLGVIIVAIIALVTVFESKDLSDPPMVNMYTLHSWLGICTLAVFTCQYVIGFVTYLVPGLKDKYKIALMPLHIYFGLFGFVLAISSGLIGLSEKIFWVLGNSYSSLPSSGIIVNFIGLLMVLFGGLVVFLATEPRYKRRSVPEEVIWVPV